jgi:hypothetical protein
MAASNGFIKHKTNAPQEWEVTRVGSDLTTERDWGFPSGALIVLSAREGPLIRVPPGGATDGRRGGGCVPVSERSAEYVQRLPHLARRSSELLPADSGQLSVFIAHSRGSLECALPFLSPYPCCSPVEGYH